MSATTSTSTSRNELHLGEPGRRAMLIAAAVGIGGVLLSVLLYIFNAQLPLGDLSPSRFFRSYLTAFMLVTAISLGGLIFTMIQHATHAGWSATVRRLFELMAANLRWIWILFIPIAVAMFMSGRTHLYEWAVPGVTEHDHVLAGKESYLNATDWLIRGVVILVIWAALAHFFFATSVKQDRTGDVAQTIRMERVAPIGCLLFALTITIAAIDWVMSLEPHWFSTIFGVYLFAASSAAFLSAVIIAAYVLRRWGKLVREITVDHYQDLGKLLFAFGVVFWAYIAFSQFMLIWYANMPEETTWFIIRGIGGWWGLSMLLLFGHFLVPFVVLISRHPKRRPAMLAVAAGWMLFMAFCDLYWLVMPKVPAALLHNANEYTSFIEEFHTATMPPEALVAEGLNPEVPRTWVEVFGFNPHLVDLTWIVGLLALYAAATLYTASRCALMPLHDPRLAEGLHFENA